MKDIGIAIVGYGGMGEKHSRLVLNTAGCYLTGVYDILPERGRAAEQAGFSAYVSLNELLADDVAMLVIVATPNDSHEDLCVEAMKAGKHVICEKPAAMDSAALSRMIQTAEYCRTLFTIHQNRRWDEDFLTVKRIFDEEIIGKVFTIESRVHGSRGIPGDWRKFKACGGGMVLDWGVHLLDQVVTLAGRDILSVYAQLSYINGGECDDGFKILVKYDSNLTFHVEVGTTNFISLPRWYMLGKTGSAVINDWALNGQITALSSGVEHDAVPVTIGAGMSKTMAPRDAESLSDFPLPEPAVMCAGFLENVLDAIRGNAELIVKPEQAMFVMRLMEAVFLSSEEDRVVEGAEFAKKWWVK